MRALHRLVTIVLILQACGSASGQETKQTAATGKWLREARAILGELESPEDAGYAATSLAFVNHDLQNIEARDEALRLAFAKGQKIINPLAAVEFFHNLAEICHKMKVEDGARRAQLEAESLCPQIDNPYSRSEYLARLAGLAWRRGDEASWTKLFEKARDSARSIGEGTLDSERGTIHEHFVRCLALAGAWKFDEALTVTEEWVKDRDRMPYCAREYANVLFGMAAKYGVDGKEEPRYEAVYFKAQHYLGRGAIDASIRDNVLWLLMRSDAATGRWERALLASGCLNHPNDRNSAYMFVLRALARNDDSTDLDEILKRIPLESPVYAYAHRWHVLAVARRSECPVKDLEVRMDRLKGSRDKFYGALGLADGLHIRKKDLPKNATKTPSIKPADIPLRVPFDPLRAKLFGYWREAAEREIDRPSAKLKGQAEPKDKVGSNPTTGLQKTRLRTILAGEMSHLGRRPDDDDYRRTVAAARQAWLQCWLDLAAEKLENRSPVAESAFQFKVQAVLHALADLHEVQLRMGDNEGAAATLRLLGKAIEILPAQSALRLTPTMRPSWIAFVGGRWARMGDRELGEAWLRSAHFAVIPSVGNSDYSKQTNHLTALFAAEAGNLKRCKEEAEFLKNVPRRLSESAAGYAAFAHGRLALASLKAGDQREAMAAIRFALSLESEYGVTTTDLLPAIEALALMDNGLEAMKPLRKAWQQFGVRGEELSRIAAALADQGHLKLVDEIQKRASPEENQERVYHALAKRQALAKTDLQKVYRDIQDLPTPSQRAASYLGVMSALLKDIQAKGP